MRHAFLSEEIALAVTWKGGYPAINGPFLGRHAQANALRAD
jgi:hypothetical protein